MSGPLRGSGYGCLSASATKCLEEWSLPHKVRNRTRLTTARARRTLLSSVSLVLCERGSKSIVLAHRARLRIEDHGARRQDGRIDAPTPNGSRRSASIARSSPRAPPSGGLTFAWARIPTERLFRRRPASTARPRPRVGRCAADPRHTHGAGAAPSPLGPATHLA